MQLVLDTNGLSLKKRNNSFWIVSKKHRRVISPHRISSIAVIRDCMISTAAIRLAIKHKIPIFFFSYAGNAEGSLWSPYFGSIATIRRNQLKLAETEAATSLMVDWFQLKLERQRLLIKALMDVAPQISNQSLVTAANKLALQSKKMNTFRNTFVGNSRMKMMGTEGVAARAYWQAISGALPIEWKFEKRSRRPAADPFNGALNYLFGMLYNLVEQASLAAGLDPMLGYLHVDNYLKTTFVFDAIEPFRPWVEALLIDCIKEVSNQKMFFDTNKGYRLNKAGRKFYIPKFNAYFEEVIAVGQQRLSRRNHIYYFLGSFAQTLKSEPT